MLNVSEKLNIQVPLFVEKGVQTEKRNFERVNSETGETEEQSFLAYALNGVLLTDEYGPHTYKSLNVNIDSQGRHGMMNPIDVANTFMEHMTDLASGKKYVLADVTLVPRGKAGSGINALYPNLKSISIVDADAETSKFIAGYIADSQGLTESPEADLV